MTRVWFNGGMETRTDRTASAWVADALDALYGTADADLLAEREALQADAEFEVAR